MRESGIRTRLSVLYFIQFGMWGCYLTCLGQLLGAGGLGSDIAWFYAAVGFVSLLFPALIGHLADRYIAASRLLGLCHLCGSVLMLIMWWYTMSHEQLSFGVMFPLYVVFLCCYMPTLALINTVSFGWLKRCGLEPVNVFGGIRVWGTVGFVAAMWFVNSAYWHDGSLGFTLDDSSPMAPLRFQYNGMQLLATGVVGLLLTLYTLTLPATKRSKTGGRGWKAMLGLQGVGLLRAGYVRVFLCLAVLAGVCLQITNGFATPFISHFRGVAEYAGSAAAGNATMLFSLSQISEAVCVLLVGWFMRRWGIKWVLVTALSAWALRFWLFAAGNPGSGLWMLIGSMLVYGVAFNFFSIAGHIYMDQITAGEHRGLGQGLLMLMTNGIGASAGTLIAGSVVNHYCQWQMTTTPAGPMRLFMGDWPTVWSIFGLYALGVGVLYLVFFHPRKGEKRA